MGNRCCGLCPNHLQPNDNEDPERQRLISSPQLSYDGGQPPYCSSNSPDVGPTEAHSDITTLMADILKVVESQVVNAGTTDYNPLDSQEYMERSRFYAENVARRLLGPPFLPVMLPRAFGNPISIIDAPITDATEIQEVKSIAKRNGDLVREMNNQEKDDLIANFTQTLT